MNTTLLQAPPKAESSADYIRIEGQLQRLGQARDALASQMRSALLGAAFYGRALGERQARALIAAGDRLLGRAAVLGA